MRWEERECRDRRRENVRMCRKEEETVENVETGGERIYVETEGEKMYRKDEEKVDTGGVNVETGVERR